MACAGAGVGVWCVFLARPLRVAADVAQPQQHHGLVAPFGSASSSHSVAAASFLFVILNSCKELPFAHCQYHAGSLRVALALTREHGPKALQ